MSHKKYVVQVMCAETDSVVREVVCGNSEKYAEKIENGLVLTWNPDKYYTRIIERTIDKP